MLAEPNNQTTIDIRDWDVWTSPDVWVRNAQDGGREHQNPEYFSNSAPNYVYARVRNVGCGTFTPTGGTFFKPRIALYWSKLSTGQRWASDWTTALVQGAGSNLLPGGLEITNVDTSSPNVRALIPSLAPGDTFVVSRAWVVPKPENYDANTTIMQACLLARITQTASQGSTGIYPPEVSDVNVNVRNSVRVIMRNVAIFNLGRRGNRTTVRGAVDIANSGDELRTFAVEIITDKDVHRHFAGDLSKYLYATVHLGDLYEVWAKGGYLGNAEGWDDEARTVTYDPASPLLLENMTLEPGSRYPIFLDFVLRDGVAVPFDISGHTIYVRQLLHDGEQRPVFGSTSFDIRIDADPAETPPVDPEARSQQAQQPASVINATTAAADARYRIFPNPVYDQLLVTCTLADCESTSLTITDITGRIVLAETAASFRRGRHTVNTSKLAPGTYFIRLLNPATREAQTLKFIKSE